jgi:RNA polymerase sigma-70 factor, ECF subfamily
VGLLLTRYSSLSADLLIRECAESGERAAWEEFVSRFNRAISLSVIRAAHLWSDVPRQLVEDLIQETYLKICADECRLLLDFAARNPDAVSGYIKTIAVNVVHDHFKGLHAQKRGAGQKQESLDEVNPRSGNKALGSPEAMEHQILLKEIDDYLNICSDGADRERDRLVFWLYYQQGMSAKAIATLPNVGLTAKGVESLIFRLTRLVRQRIVDLRSASSEDQKTGPKGFRPAESY